MSKIGTATTQWVHLLAYDQDSRETTP